MLQIQNPRDKTLFVPSKCRKLVNGWRAQVGRPVLPAVAGLEERRSIAEYLSSGANQVLDRQNEVITSPPSHQGGTAAEQARTPAQPARPGGSVSDNGAALFLASTGDSTRDEAVAILAHALAPAFTPHEVAAQLEQQLFLDHRDSASGRPGDEYLRALRALWGGLSPRSSSFRPLLRLLLLHGDLPVTALLRSPTEELEKAEQAFADQMLKKESVSPEGDSGPPHSDSKSVPPPLPPPLPPLPPPLQAEIEPMDLGD